MESQKIMNRLFATLGAICLTVVIVSCANNARDDFGTRTSQSAPPASIPQPEGSVADTPITQLHIALNWGEELERLVPTN